jgi:peptidoglycan/LPS O-acetylase OafA/YrhL
MTASHYRPDIDGLRAVAVLAVLGYHAFPDVFPGGFIGVDIFFVISGYLITKILLTHRLVGYSDFIYFYSKRIIRIFPALAIVLISCLVFGWFFLLKDEYVHLAKYTIGAGLFVSNILSWLDSGYFDISAETKPLLHLWSLGVEEQFYIIWPIIILLVRKLGMSLLTVIVLIIAASFTCSVMAQHYPTAGFFLIPARSWELLAGGFAGYLSLNNHNNNYKVFSVLGRLKTTESFRKLKDFGLHRSRKINIFASLGFILIVCSFIWVDSSFLFPGYIALIPVLGTFIIIFTGPTSWVNHQILANRLLVFIGLISFPLYLWHWPLLVFYHIVSGGENNAAIKIGLLFLSFILATATYYYIEQPFRRSERLSTKAVFLLILMLLIVSVASVIHRKTGFGDRFTGAQSNLAQLEYAFPNTKECRDHFDFARESCYESSAGLEDTIMLIGDSHMEALAHGFIQLGRHDGLSFNLLAIGKAGCSPFLNTESYTDFGVNYNCKGIIEPALQVAIKRPDIKWVILTGRHAARFNGSAFGRAEQDLLSKPWSYQYNSEAFKTNDPQLAFQLGLRDTVAALTAAGKKVLFVDQVPELGFFPRNCLRFRSFYKTDCDITRVSADARMNPYKHAVAQILSKVPNAYIFDPISLFCNRSHCSAFNSDNQLLYRDDDHMSKIAADTIASSILDVIQQQK